MNSQRKIQIPKNSVRLALIEGVDIQLSQTNAVFIIYRDRVSHPYLKDGALVVPGGSDYADSVPTPAKAKLLALLEKKAQIRRDNPLDFDEDDAAFTFWNVT